MIRVGVIRGGTSPEYDVSLASGGAVLAHLRGEKLSGAYKPVDILIDKNGAWHMNGIPTTLEKISLATDVVVNALHGDFGEDGKVQQMLEAWGIPYTGSGPFASAIGYNKALSKEKFASLGIQTPKHILYPAYQEDFDGPRELYAQKKAKEVWERLPPPWIVKPLTGGSSVGIHACKTFPELVRAFTVGVGQDVSILVEEMIEGREATVGVIEKFRGADVYAMPPIEIRVPKDKKYFDSESKYQPDAGHVSPGRFSRQEKEELERLAKLIHSELGMQHYSRSDFIVHPRRGIYMLEVNTLPGLTDESLIPSHLHTIGSNMPEFLSHIIELARSKK